ncbi:hypothetical protein [Brevibacterium casei]|uniref:hypothetical protein n=1 Tax=Brevibacterium casei TaxID=33889 RepID=UPI00167D3AB6|nr:hypothetical protein [Brevibacterium casei]
MLDNGAWSKLISGLTQATEAGKLQWERKETRAGYGGISGIQKTAFSALMDQRVLRARSNKTTYELTADSFGRAPYELTVWDTVDNRKKPIGSTTSSTDVQNRGAVYINSQLERLFKIADSSIEDPDEVVNRLLGDLGTD